MGISLSTGSLSGFFWTLVAVYAVVVWVFRIRIYRTSASCGDTPPKSSWKV